MIKVENCDLHSHVRKAVNSNKNLRAKANENCVIEMYVERKWNFITRCNICKIMLATMGKTLSYKFTILCFENV